MCLITSFINIDKQCMGLYFQVFALVSQYMRLPFWGFIFGSLFSGFIFDLKIGVYSSRLGGVGFWNPLVFDCILYHYWKD